MVLKPFQNNSVWRYTKLNNPNHYIPKSPKLQSKRFWIIVLFGICGLIIFIHVCNYGKFEHFSFASLKFIIGQETGVDEQNASEYKPAYLINTSGCKISYLDPHDPEVYRLYFRNDISMACDSKYLPRLFGSNDSAIFILPERKPLYVDDKTEINCCWSSIIRVPNNDSQITFNETCNSFANSANIDVEFIQVLCSKKTNPWYLFGYERTVEIYKDYFYFVPRKPEVEKRCLKARENLKSEDPPLSVLIVGLDSVSRVNFHRQMPKTAQALRDLGSIEMLGYNKIGYNTFPNVLAVLSGQSETEIDKGCWKDHKTFDDCDLIWKNFSSAGYRTILGEDGCHMATFNYLKQGFRNPPTDYFLRPYCLAIEKNIGNTWRSFSNMCVGSILNFENLLNYTRKVATTFADDPYFAFFWEASLTHDYMDLPRFGDDAYGGFLQYLKTDNLLRNTVLVFMSDHGIRWGAFRQTNQGDLEESLPFMFLAFPEWWKSKHPEAIKNLNENTLRLTTPFDLHETLRDILHPSTIDTISKTMSRGISWFSPVPESRTCEDAAIPETYCSCHKAQKKVSLWDKNVKKTADFLVNAINGMLSKYPKCAKLEVNAVTDVKYWRANVGDSKKVSHDYTTTLETVPGKAIFQGTVRYIEGEKITVLGQVSRLNAYGNSSACVDDFKLRLYCYCL